MLADLTPPDAVTSFAAANIAGAEPMATGIEGFRLGLAGFLVPFAFVFQPGLLLMGSWGEILVSLALTVFGVVCLAAGVIGHFFTPIPLLLRAVLVAAAGLLVFSAQSLEAIGLTAGAAVLGWSFLRRKASSPAAVK